LEVGSLVDWQIGHILTFPDPNVPISQVTNPPVHLSARERTSAASFPAGLSVSGPASLGAVPRLLFSVTAFVYWIKAYYTKVSQFVKSLLFLTMARVCRAARFCIKM
jgi:hypothetical protein